MHAPIRTPSQIVRSTQRNYISGATYGNEPASDKKKGRHVVGHVRQEDVAAQSSAGRRKKWQIVDDLANRRRPAVRIPVAGLRSRTPTSSASMLEAIDTLQREVAALHATMTADLCNETEAAVRRRRYDAATLRQPTNNDTAASSAERARQTGGTVLGNDFRVCVLGFQSRVALHVTDLLCRSGVSHLTLVDMVLATETEGGGDGDDDPGITKKSFSGGGGGGGVGGRGRDKLTGKSSRSSTTTTTSTTSNMFSRRGAGQTRRERVNTVGDSATEDSVREHGLHHGLHPIQRRLDEAQPRWSLAGGLRPPSLIQCARLQLLSTHPSVTLRSMAMEIPVPLHNKATATNKGSHGSTSTPPVKGVGFKKADQRKKWEPGARRGDRFEQSTAHLLAVLGIQEPGTTATDGAEKVEKVGPTVVVHSPSPPGESDSSCSSTAPAERRRRDANRVDLIICCDDDKQVRGYVSDLCLCYDIPLVAALATSVAGGSGPASVGRALVQVVTSGGKTACLLCHPQHDRGVGEHGLLGGGQNEELLPPAPIPSHLFLPGSSLVVAGMAVRTSVKLLLDSPKGRRKMHQQIKLSEGASVRGDGAAAAANKHERREYDGLRSRVHATPALLANVNCPSDVCRRQQHALRQQRMSKMRSFHTGRSSRIKPTRASIDATGGSIARAMASAFGK